ncbi:MAG: hypothetical protein ACJ76Z_05275 [Thermoleophilaceae bacterium]
MEAGDQAYSDNGTSQSPWEAHEAAADATGRPEVPVLAALAGGFILAKLIGALAGGDDE